MTAEQKISKLATSSTGKYDPAVKLGRRGGNATAKKYGRDLYVKMGQRAAITRERRYGKTEFAILARFGFPVSKMTKKEREDALAKIEADRADRLRRKKPKMR